MFLFSLFFKLKEFEIKTLIIPDLSFFDCSAIRSDSLFGDRLNY